MCAQQTEPRIETERLVLRTPRLEDAWRVAYLVNDFDIARMTTRIPHPYALVDAEAFLAVQAAADRRQDAHFAIEHRDFGLIGGAGVHRGRGGPVPEVGYWLGRAFWNRGLATEALSAILAWADSGFGARALLAGYFSDNSASGRVLEKAGFLYTGDVEPRRSLARGEIAPTRMMVWLA